MPLNNVLQLHIEEASCLSQTRVSLIAAPRIALRDLTRFDGRIEAHLDGLSMAGEAAWQICQVALETPTLGAIFCATVRVIDDKRRSETDRLFALAEAVPEMRQALASAFAWVEPSQLRGIVIELLDAEDPLRRHIGIDACAMHRVDPGLVSGRGILDKSLFVRARGLRAAGELGCEEALSSCDISVQDADPECRFWAAWSSVLLGNRGTALDTLTSTGLAAGWHRDRAFRLALQAMSLRASHRVLQPLRADPQQLRWLIQGRGKRPEHFESGPNDDPDDPNVDMDPDDGLPWPDVSKIEKWWSDNSNQFQEGMRYFMGKSVTRDNCINVLKNGYQRQRILAANYLCLLEPGTPLFDTSAPAWRQQRLLEKMS
jgi:uncharacterized protein (TIGR02270 family)